MKGEKCPNCGRFTFKPFIDPNIGGYMKCSSCGCVVTESESDELD